MSAPKGSQNAKGHGRPSILDDQKYGQEIIDAFEKVLSDREIHVMYRLEDIEIIFLINEELRSKGIDYEVDDSSFNRWKHKSKDDAFAKKHPNLILFLRFYKKALVDAKDYLFTQMKDENLWQKWAWILERKYKQWNLKKLNEVSGPDGKPVDVIDWGKIPLEERKKMLDVIQAARLDK